MAFEFAFLDWLQQFAHPVMDALAVFFNWAGMHGELWDLVWGHPAAAPFHPQSRACYAAGTFVLPAGGGYRYFKAPVCPAPPL